MNLLASLRYLVALHEHRHFGRAAQACHITQPALSNALRALEKEFGVVVVRRSRSFEGFTPEGERVLATAQRMLHEHQVLQQDLQSDAAHPRGTLKLGAVPTAMPILARFAAQLQARHPGIVPVALSMSSQALEAGLENISLDLALGYTDRMPARGSPLRAWPQYVEHYFLLRRAPRLTQQGPAHGLQIGPPLGWAEAAALPLCLLTPEMHNRSLVDGAFLSAGATVRPAMETDSVLTLALCVVAGEMCSILPGALVDAVRGHDGLEALPLTGPVLTTPIGFISHRLVQPTRALDAALALAQDADWLQHAAAHSGLLSPS
ncbi:LysR family transcriptional regulator [Acidovorax sp.]|uniref:LysR family transcriptional regulator n=1 Tax=Acidovorax sp. TaxID=1872122 RepID=UPI00391D79F2